MMNSFEETTLLLKHTLEVNRPIGKDMLYQAFDVGEFTEGVKLIWLTDIELTQLQHAQEEDFDVGDTVWYNVLIQEQVLIEHI